jgi:tripeptide aminopeptidase
MTTSAIAPRQLVELFLELAGIDGLSGRERAVADHVIDRLGQLGYEVNEQPVSGSDCGNLLCRVAGGGRILLTAHLDTARPTGAVRPQVRADRITSDGTTPLGVDNRVGVALLVHLLERVAANDIQVEPFTVAFTVREETDLAGSRTLDPGREIDRAVVLDSSLRPGHYIHAAPGARSWVARITGRPAHAGLAPERGVSAIEVAAAALRDIPQGRLDDATTANVGLIRGGSSVNTVPAEVALEGEVRSSEPLRAMSVLEQIGGCIRRAAAARGARFELDARWDFEPFTLPLDAPVCRHVEAALRRAGLEPRPVISSGGSDANSLNAKGIPAVNIGVGAQNPHSDDEFILLEDLAAAARIAAALVAAESD